MRRHGWGGHPPANEQEARQRILEAGMRCVDRHGAMDASLSDVAAELGVTRQTVYRYFASTESLFQALAENSASDFIDRVVARMRSIDDPIEAAIEGLAFGIESLPDEQYMALLLRSGDAFTQGIISPVAMAFGHELLRRSHVDWPGLGWDEVELDGLVEFMLRLIQSLASTPTTPTGTARTSQELRAFLRRWLAPALRVPSMSSAGVVAGR